MLMKTLAFFILLAATTTGATIKTQTLEYYANGKVHEGFVAYDNSKSHPIPAILIVHDWMGLGNFTKEKAVLLAKQGYFAFAVDLYGKGVRPKDNAEASQFATQYKNDRKMLREDLRAAYDKLLTRKEVDPKKIAIMGYCFGGTAALELARSGAPLVGTISFHGGLDNPTPDDAKNIKGQVLILHGADDPNVPPAQVAAFKEEMQKAGIKMEFIAYPGAVHAFTNRAAGKDNSKGVAYNAQADRRSWHELEKFLAKIFDSSPTK